MNFSRGVLVAGLAATLLACSSSDTILALNVTSTEDVGPVSKLQVTIAPRGESAFTTEFEPPSREVDGGSAIALRFFERIKLPDSWERVLTDVQVDALDETGTAFLSAATQVTIRPEGAVAAFVMFARPAPPSEGGAGGEAGASGAGGASGGAGDNSGGSPVDAGAGGAAAGGGGVPDAGAGGASGAGAGSVAGGASGDGGSAGSTEGGAFAGG